MRYFTTANTQLAAWLLQTSFIPEAVRSPDDPSKVEFQFEKTIELEDAVAAF